MASPNDLYNIAVDLRNRGRWKQAIRTYKKAFDDARVINSYPIIQAKCLHEQALCFKGLGKISRAIEQYEIAAKFCEEYYVWDIFVAVNRDYAWLLATKKHPDFPKALNLLDNNINNNTDNNQRLKSDIFRQRIVVEQELAISDYKDALNMINSAIDKVRELQLQNMDLLESDLYFLMKTHEYLEIFHEKIAILVRNHAEEINGSIYLVDRKKMLVRKTKKWLRDLLL